MLNAIVGFLKAKDELAEARSLLQVFEKYASGLEEYDTLGRLFHDVKDYASAIRVTKRALFMAESSEAIYACNSNLAKLYNHANDGEAALYHLSLNEAQNPGDPEILLERVFSLFLLNRKKESEAILRELVSRPDLDEKVRQRCEFNLGTYDLYQGEFQKGLKAFILGGKEVDVTKKRDLPLPQWEGQPLPRGTKVLIAAEAGIGDELINFRFCIHLKMIGLVPVWLTANRPDLATVFNRMGVPSYSTFEQAVEVEGPDLVWCYAMALPIYLNLVEADLWIRPYLVADPQTQSLVEKTIPSVPYKLNIGIRWNGNPFYDHDLHRGLPLPELVKAVTKPGHEIYSLQRDDGASDIDAFPQVHKLREELATWERTLASLSCMDLVVTSCTSVAHASAALGMRTIVMVPIAAYYTWASTHDSTSIWYGDNVRVIRQTSPNSWEAQMEELKTLVEIGW